MRVEIIFHSSSLPVVLEDVKDVYTKDALFCVSFRSCRKVIKYPLVNIFSITSDYEQK